MKGIVIYQAVAYEVEPTEFRQGQLVVLPDNVVLYVEDWGTTEPRKAIGVRPGLGFAKGKTPGETVLLQTADGESSMLARRVS